MLTDPQSVTLSGTAISLPRLDERADTHVYTNRASKVDLFVTQRVDKNAVSRSSVSLVTTVNVTDPVTGLVSKQRPSVNVSFAIPDGVLAADLEASYAALTNALEAGTNALLKKILGGEK